MSKISCGRFAFLLFAIYLSKRLCPRSPRSFTTIFPKWQGNLFEHARVRSAWRVETACARGRFKNHNNKQKMTFYIHVQYHCNMSNGHLNVHWIFLFVQWTNGHLKCPLDISVRPMDEWTFEMSNGYFCLSNGQTDICVCPVEIIDI